MHITTYLSDDGDGRTRFHRSFLWDEPADPEVAEGLRQMMQATVLAGEGAITAAFEETQPGYSTCGP